MKVSCGSILPDIDSRSILSSLSGESTRSLSSGSRRGHVVVAGLRPRSTGPELSKITGNEVDMAADTQLEGRSGSPNFGAKMLSRFFLAFSKSATLHRSKVSVDASQIALRHLWIYRN